MPWADLAESEDGPAGVLIPGFTSSVVLN